MKFECEDKNCGKIFNDVIDQDMIFEDPEFGKYAITNCPECGSWVTSFDVEA